MSSADVLVKMAEGWRLTPSGYWDNRAVTPDINVAQIWASFPYFTRVSTYLHVQWNRPSQKHTCLVISRSIFSQKKSKTSSEDHSVRAVCLDGSLSAPRSRTWRTCFYILLFISQPEQNIRAWGKKIIKLEVHAEVWVLLTFLSLSFKCSPHRLGPWHLLLALGA